ncbi:TPA: hypothetical protein ACXAXR_002808 [Acinetobacter baumannii]|uniref:hypothetical protein n=1 Tax=Acinetobacter baumannii TaxID=470 RepID=UPI001EE8ACAC|nr:hypothetical protein [Acinetobacter baumannii]MCG5976014.1 hypothetical protein [Acinetobacter baumannii]
MTLRQTRYGSYPDAYQYERAARFNCGVSSIGAALKRLNITVDFRHKSKNVQFI